MNEFQPVNVADIYAKADASNANAQNMQINAYKLKSAQNEDAKQLAVENLYKSAVSPDGTTNHESIKTGLMQLGMPDKAAAYQENLNKQKMGELKLGDEYKSRHTQNMMQLVYDPKPDLAHKIIDQDVAQGFIKPEDAQGLHDMVPNDPEQVRQMAWTLLKHSQAPEKQLEQYSREQLYAGDTPTQAEPEPVATNGFDMSTPEKRAQVMSDINRIVDPAEKAAVMASITGSPTTQPAQQNSKLPYDPAKIKKARMLGLVDDAKAMQDANDKFSEGYNKPFFNDGTPNNQYQEFKLTDSKSGSSNTNISVSTDKKYGEIFGSKLAEQDASAIDAAKSAPERIDSSRRVKQLLAQNPTTGTGAGARLALEKAFVTAGLIDGTNVANTEALASNLASQTLDAIKTSGLGSGQGFTDKDRIFLQEAKSGRIEMNNITLNRLADLNERAALKSIEKGNNIIRSLKSNKEMGDVGNRLEEIQIPSSQEPVKKGLPLPSNPLSLKKGGVYETPKGTLKWNGKSFEDL